MALKIRMKKALLDFKDFMSRYKEDKLAMAGLAFLITSVFVAFLAPWISPYQPDAISADGFIPPSLGHLMGTDSMGRDVFSGIIWGTRVSLLFSVVAGGISMIVGIFVGSISAYYGGKIDDIGTGLTDAFLMIPRILLIILVVAIFGNNVYFTMTIVGLTWWPSNARIIRGQVLTLKSREYVSASRAAGATRIRALFTHVIPNGLYPVISNTAIFMAFAILLEASLAFLGLADMRVISWGQMLFYAHFQYRSAWWTAVFPGLSVILLALSFNLIGDGLNYAFNPRLRKR